MSSPVIQNFMKQQGFAAEPPDACNMHFAGLYFQPRIVFPTLLVGILLQSPAIFLAVSALLWWNVLVPRLNPFEQVYNRFLAARRGTPPLVPAPGPRRFAQAMAAAFTLGAGLCLLAGMERRLLGLPGVPGRGLLRALVRQVLHGGVGVPRPAGRSSVCELDLALGSGLSCFPSGDRLPAAQEDETAAADSGGRAPPGPAGTGSDHGLGPSCREPCGDLLPKGLLLPPLPPFARTALPRQGRRASPGGGPL